MNPKIKNKQQVVKRDIKFLNYENLDKIGEIPIYYGFSTIKGFTITKADMEAAKEVMEGDYIDDETDKHGHLPLNVEEKIALIRMYHEENLHILPQPVLLYFKDPCKGQIKKTSYPRYADLEIMGSSGSIAEAIIIQTAIAMLKEEGYDNMTVEINSIGDKESITRFAKELTVYYRKQMNEMNAGLRQLFKKDPFELLASKDEAAVELNSKAPRSMDFLTETSRKHLEEVLEYLEALNIPYVINNSLLGNKKYCTETIFSIIDMNAKPKDQKILAMGVRYNSLSKRLGMKRDIQGVGISLLIKNRKNGLRKPVTKFKKPIASFVQLGMESKLVALNVVEMLRKEKIPLYLSLAKDRLGAQVSTVEKYHTPYVIVIGKKEAVESTAIVRHTDTHSQSIIPLNELPKYLKSKDK